MTETASELPPAVGEGAELFDERALFYLQFQSDIEEWARLRWDAIQATSKWLESLTDIVEALGDWEPWSGTISKYRCLGVSPVGSQVGAAPWTCIALGWNPNGVRPTIKGDSSSPFVGLYTSPSHQLAPIIRQAVDQHDATHPPAVPYLSTDPWPRFQYVVASEGWLGNLDLYRRELISGVQELVQRYSDAIDRTIESN